MIPVVMTLSDLGVISTPEYAVSNLSLVCALAPCIAAAHNVIDCGSHL